MPRHKFQMFASPDELRREIHDAIITELIRGYRDRYRINEADIETLLQASAETREELPGLILRRANRQDQDQVQSLLLELKRWYPNIEQWIPKIIDDLEKDDNIRVADLGGTISGIAVARDKGDSTRKFSTIYVSPDSQGAAIGPHLVREEVKRAAADGVRKSYITFAGEIEPRIRPILLQSGFVDEGISSARYRPESVEIVMGKPFAYDEIDHEVFANFVRRHLVLNSGGMIVSSQDSEFTATMPTVSPLSGIKHQDMRFIISSQPNPEMEYDKLRGVAGDSDWTLVSLYGRPAQTDDQFHDVANWIDGADLAMRYFPLQVNTPRQDAIIVTILPHYADALIPHSSTPPLFEPSRLQIRPDNVYYRTADRYTTLRRGARVFFYVSQPESAIRGSAIITGLTVDTPEQCFARYGSKGILQFSELVNTAGDSNKVLAIAFDWYIEYPHPVKLDQVKEIVDGYQPITANVVNGMAAHRIHERGLNG